MIVPSANPTYIKFVSPFTSGNNVQPGTSDNSVYDISKQGLVMLLDIYEDLEDTQIVSRKLITNKQCYIPFNMVTNAQEQINYSLVSNTLTGFKNLHMIFSYSDGEIM